MPWEEVGMRELHQLYKDVMVGGMGFHKGLILLQVTGKVGPTVVFCPGRMS